MTAYYLSNRMPIKGTNKTPYELYIERKPNMQHIRVFGSKAFAYIPKEKRTKWDARSEEEILIGYSER